MKLSAYIVRFDSGFAPNPFGHYCTLACCKPTIRRKAEKDDIIVGVAASRLPQAGRLIYAMRVNQVLSYEEYWKDPRFACRKPSSATPISRRGDNIWHRDANGNWQVASPAFHNKSARWRDTSGKNALIATEFFYFGRKAIRISRNFSSLLAKTQGHKNTYDRDKIVRFWDWLCSKAPKPGRIAYPSEFTDDACRAQCSEIEDEDIEEAYS